MDRAELLSVMRSVVLEIKAVHVPGWGDLHVRELTVETVDKLNKAKSLVDGDEVNALALSAAATICDETGDLIFDLSNPEDIKLLSRQGFGKLSRVLKAANTLAVTEESLGNV